MQYSLAQRPLFLDIDRFTLRRNEDNLFIGLREFVNIFDQNQLEYRVFALIQQTFSSTGLKPCYLRVHVGHQEHTAKG